MNVDVLLNIVEQVFRVFPFEVFLKSIAQVWYLVPIFIVVKIFKSNWFKGVMGEYLVNRSLSKLPHSHYTLLKDVTLPTKDGSTQIDHVVVSTFGIFVVETKNMQGWIFGSENQRQWNQTIFRHKVKFQNPLRQNYKHIKTLEHLLGCNKEIFHSVVVFVGNCKFKTDMPQNVTKVHGCIRYIKQFQEEVLTANECHEIIETINNIKFSRGVTTNRMHRKNVQTLVASKEALKK